MLPQDFSEEEIVPIAIALASKLIFAHAPILAAAANVVLTDVTRMVEAIMRHNSELKDDPNQEMVTDTAQAIKHTWSDLSSNSMSFFQLLEKDMSARSNQSIGE